MSLQDYIAKKGSEELLSFTMKPFREALTWLNVKGMKKPLTPSIKFWIKIQLIREPFSTEDLLSLKLRNPRKPSTHLMKSCSLSLGTPIPSIEKEPVLQFSVNLKKPLKPTKVRLKFPRISLKPGI
jgi:hypothetical protein